jgi:hypothetical protein
MIVWVAVMLPLLFLPIAGLMIDAGVVFDAKRDLQSVADGAARVGGMELDRAYLQDTRANPIGSVRLDPRAAERAARDYLNRVRFPGQASIDPRRDHIEVMVSREIRPTFLRLVHVGPVTIHATGRAAPCAAVVGRDCT